MPSRSNVASGGQWRPVAASLAAAFLEGAMIDRCKSSVELPYRRLRWALFWRASTSSDVAGLVDDAHSGLEHVILATEYDAS